MKPPQISPSRAFAKTEKASRHLAQKAHGQPAPQPKWDRPPDVQQPDSPNEHPSGPFNLMTTGISPSLRRGLGYVALLFLLLNNAGRLDGAELLSLGVDRYTFLRQAKDGFGTPVFVYKKESGSLRTDGRFDVKSSFEYSLYMYPSSQSAPKERAFLDWADNSYIMSEGSFDFAYSTYGGNPDWNFVKAGTRENIDGRAYVKVGLGAGSGGGGRDPSPGESWGNAPNFNAVPNDLTVPVGGTIQLIVRVNRPVIAIAFKDGLFVSLSDPRITYPDPAAYSTEAILTIVRAQPSDSGEYWFNVLDSSGGAVTRRIRVIVTGSGGTDAAPTITAQPQNQVVSIGSRVAFSITATDKAPLSFQWRKNGVNISGATGSSFTIAAAQASDAGSYSVFISNGAKSVTSNSATLTVNAGTPPVISTQPQSQTVALGQRVTLNVTVAGTALLLFQWKKNGSNIAGATTASYTITSAQTTDTGSYSVTVSNAYGTVTSGAATITVVTVASAMPPGTGWILNPANGHYYKVLDLLKWKEAQATALALGANLVTIRNAAENDWLVAQFGYVRRWIGLSDEAVEGTWVWISGEPVAFTNWLPGEPNNSGDEDHAVINFDAPGKWNDLKASDGDTRSGLIEWIPRATAMPQIESQPQSQTVAVGANLTFAVTASGSSPLSYQWQKDGANLPGANSSTYTILNVQSNHAGVYAVVVSNSSGTVTSAKAILNISTQSGVNPPGASTSYTFTVLAGKPGQVGSANGTGGEARFNYPYGLAADGSGNIYVADDQNCLIRKITPAGMVSTLAGTTGKPGNADGIGTAALFNGPRGVAADRAGNVYVADTGNSTIRKITPSGVVTTLAGSPWVESQYLAGLIDVGADGLGRDARFNGPHGIAVDASGNVYVADTYNHTIRKITASGMVTTLAGRAGTSGNSDGIAQAARFKAVYGLAVETAGNIYVADGDNYSIRKITPTGVVSTLAGVSGIRGSLDGVGGAARFFQPNGVAVDSSGFIFVTDGSAGNNTIRRINPAGVVSTLAGLIPTQGLTSDHGPDTPARFGSVLWGIAADGQGNIFVSEKDALTILKGVHSSTALTLTIQMPSGVVPVGTGITLMWSGGTGPFQVEWKARVTDATWTDAGRATERSVRLPFVGGTAFYRVRGVGP